MNEATKKRYRIGTAIIRSGQVSLPTFTGTKIHCIFVAVLPKFEDRFSITENQMDISAPSIYNIIEFEGGTRYEKVSQYFPPTNRLYFHRQTKILTNVNNMEHQQLKYGQLQDILLHYENQLQADNDIHTALIKGIHGGMQISLEKYVAHLRDQSTPTNTKEVLAKFSIHSDSIRADETPTDEVLDRLFSPNQ